MSGDPSSPPRHIVRTVYEFQCDCDLVWSEAAAKFVPSWHSHLSMDLQAVALASPYGDEATDVRLANDGAPGGRRISCNYEKFMKLWIAARQEKQ
jgi:hypothetical protein